MQTMGAAPEYRNIHGRKWGRGLRPWLLLPKVVFVGIFLGSLVSTLVLVFLPPPPVTPEGWMEHLQTIRRAFEHLVVPALLGAILCGVLLTAIQGKALLRMRWLRLKVIVVAVFVPAAHLFMHGRFLVLEEAVRSGSQPRAVAARHAMTLGLVAVIACGLLVIVLGRLKPRLGQDYAKTSSRAAEREAGKDSHDSAKS
jgi:hypothetical protein